MDWFGTTMRPLAGGYSGETFVVGEGDDEVVLRIYGRNPGRLVVDASLLRLVAGLLPVPQVLEVRPADAGQPGVLITERLPGERLDLVLPTADDWLLAAIGRNLGDVLATLSHVPMLRFGMFDGPDLSLSREPAADMRAWAEGYRDTGRLGGWSQQDWDALTRLIDDAGDLLDAPTRWVLVHSDFNPKNLLVDPVTGELTGLLDWEFAHAGSPYTDLGNLTRFERQPALVEAVIERFVASAPGLAADPLTLGRAADLWALVELAGGTPSNPVRELAAELLRAQARAGDLHAWPWVGSSSVKPLF